MSNVRAAVVQFEHANGDKAANFAKIESFGRDAAKQGVQIIAFPEWIIHREGMLQPQPFQLMDDQK
ncbi:hypothetical protein BH09SUM1_BH09SUM1_32200 [soil metagenome]